MDKFRDFFKSDTALSMARLISFLSGIAALVVSIGGVWLGYKSTLTYEYVLLTATIWAAAHGGKNWSKSVELKRGNDGNENEPKK